MIAPRSSPMRTWIACDVGSTAVKAVVVDADSGRLRDQWYLRHGTRQADGTARLLRRLEQQHPGWLEGGAVCFTGSGGRSLAQRLGCPFVQEVNAVALATERRYPKAGSIVDLGGQDAKIIVWQNTGEGEGPSARRKFFSMNDKCAGGTGAVIDRIVAKLGLPPDTVRSLRLGSIRTHPVAARCGVFAETDINGLQKQGIPPDELLASLFEAIVHQNLSVLTRGATLLPPVLLLGGPHAFLPGLVDAWREALTTLWRERRVDLPGDAGEAEVVIVPEHACYFAALGAIDYAQQTHGTAEGRSAPSGSDSGAYAGPRGDEVLRELEALLASPADLAGDPGLLSCAAEREAVHELARQGSPRGFGRSRRASLPARHAGDDQGETVCEVVMGLDAGSTSTKAVLLDLQGTLLEKAYRLSGGDPLADARALLAELEGKAAEAGVALCVRGLGVTGYAKDMLGEFLGADLALVETVAHARSALTIEPRAEVIVDIGGQDIKVLVLRDGRVRDFKLNSQCSAGNGFFLQSTARRFEIPLTEFADHAFRATRAPRFNVGCAVFLEADIVNFQQIGWQPEEILAGLVRVLPKNVWLHVVGEPNLERLGHRFILQGGTQRNEAAVKAQIDFIHDRVPGAEVRVHPHAGESGAIGAALELIRLGVGERSRFLGFEAVRSLVVRARQDESTRCRLCANRCQRTFLEAHSPQGDVRTFIVASCELGRVQEGAGGGTGRGAAERAAERAAEGAGEGAAEEAGGAPTKTPPDFSGRAARLAFTLPSGIVSGVAQERDWADQAPGLPWLRTRAHARRLRRSVRIGIPRALNLFQSASFFMGYLHALGLGPKQLITSGQTTEKLFRAGVRRGAVDSCYPTKVAMAHVHDLLFRRELDWLFFPILINLPQDQTPAAGATVCPSSQAAPEVIRAAFTREGDLFAQRNCRFLSPVFHMAEPALFERQMLTFWRPLLGVTARENRAAIGLARAAVTETLEKRLRRPALEEILRLERSGDVGLVAMGRPYHDDPGLNHRIFKDLNQRGYPIFSITALPRDRRWLMRLFGEEITRGRIAGPFDISDVWQHSFSANSNAKVWAAKIVARCPQLAALDVSSFRCGHDAPIYATVEAILEAAGRPYFTFHDIDENRPSGAIRLRVETIDYSLREYRRRFVQAAAPATAGVGETPEAAILGTL